MAVFSIEVVGQPGEWVWRIIGACGRALVTCSEVFDDDLKAFNDAKSWRTAHQRELADIDNYRELL